MGGTGTAGRRVARLNRLPHNGGTLDIPLYIPAAHGYNTGMSDETAIIGIVTVSDRASGGVYVDKGGPAVFDWLNERITTPWTAVRRVIPDDRAGIEATLCELADEKNCCLVVTTGGTGPAPRDLTPEATEAVCSRLMPGFGELMRAESLKVVPTAILSRQTAGLRGATLIVNLPGNPSAIADCLNAVFPAIPYCVELLEGPYIDTDPEQLTAFRPRHARRLEER